MRKLHWPTLAAILLVFVVVLGACSPLNGPAVASPGTAPEARSVAGGAGAVNGQAGEGLVVSGTGTASADPEVAQVGFGVELQGNDPDALVSEAAEKIDAAMAAAREFGIMEDKTRTLNYNLFVETQRDPESGRPTDEIVYHLNHRVQVTTDNIDGVGELLAGVVNAGANAVSGVNFTIEDPTSLVNEARDLAIENAQAKAEAMAVKLGIGYGDPILVTETGGNVPMAADFGVGGGARMESAAPQIESGSFSVSVSVRIVYEIQ